MLNIILFGPPGAGKGTQSERIIKKYDLIHIATGDLFRKHMSEGTELGKLAQQYIKEGKLVPDEVTIKMVDAKIEENKNATGFIFDGFPRTVAQAQTLDSILKNKKSPISGVVALEVPDNELRERLKERAKTSGRVDDQDEEKINTRLNVYHQETSPVANHYDKLGKLKRVNGVGTIDGIFDAICQAIQSFQK
jgi:adenylate kinase